MLLNQLFSENPPAFEKRCRTRIGFSILLIVLGLASLLVTAVTGGRIPALYPQPDPENFISGFYLGIGFALIASGIITILKNLHYLHAPKQRRQKEIAENDERNRMLGLRCWAYSGYCLFLLLYIGILAAGFISILILKTLLLITATYALLLLLFRIFLQKTM